VRFPAVRLIIILGLLPMLAGSPAASSDLGRLLPSEISGWKASGGDRTFTRDTILDYLDGAGETCLGYAFRRLLVREFSGPAGASLVAEIYDMSRPADAYGISADDPDGEEAAVGRNGLYSGGRLRFWKGPYFVRLLAGRGTAATRGLLEEMGRSIAAAIREDGARPRLMDCLPTERLDRKSLRYFHKQVSLNSHYYLADENVLLLDEDTEAALGAYRAGWEKALLLICRYRSAADAGRAFLKFGRAYFSVRIDAGGGPVLERIETGKYAGVRRAGAFVIIVFDSPDRPGCASLLRAATSRIGQVYPSRGRDPETGS
jgi:hypothetical protein